MNKNSPKKRETPTITRAQLFKEQKKLADVQKELKKMLNDVAQHLNILKVEELQIKSSLIQQSTVSMKRSREPEPSTSYVTEEDEDEINRQEMDLKVPMNFEDSDSN